MEKLDPKTDGSTPDIVEQNVEQLKALFPEIVTEGKVDFDVLQEVLGDYTDEREERYSFTWNGKSRARRLAQTPSTGTLQPCPEESVNWDTTQNLFIEGENLEVLKLLQKSYHRKVKMIYIDPPYNTGNDFIYPDNFRDSIGNYLKVTGQVDEEGKKLSTNAETSGRYHTDWLNMMFPRLHLARNLLRDDGLILISIDHKERARLQFLCDSIFGEENFVECVTWKKRYGAGGGSKGFARLHEYILVYSKNQIESVEAPLSEDQIEAYKGRDDKHDKRGGFVTQPLATSSKGERANLMYEIEHQGKTITPKPGSRWLWSKPKFDQAYANDEIVISEGSDGFSVRFKQYLKDEQGRMRNGKPLSIKSDVFNQEGTKEIAELLGDRGIFEFPKPARLLEYFFSFIVNDQRDDDGIYLDFFAGSASSAHAVLNLNARDARRRRFIMVQLPEPCNETSDAFKHGYKTIAEIGKERIRRVIRGLAIEIDKQRAADRAKLLQAGSGVVSHDLGFRVLKLDTSSIKAWDAEFEDVEGALLSSVENVKPDRSEADVLYELLLKFGLDLAVPIEQREIAGKTVHIIGAGALIVCLADEIGLDVVEGIAALKDELSPETIRVVFKDSGFADDVVKTNAVQILHQAGIEDVKSL